MKAPASRSVENIQTTSAESSKGKVAKGHRDNNPLWHRLSTHDDSEVPPIQRMCAECEDELSGIGANPVQPKLAVGAPDDPYEQEADAVAAQVMRTPLDDESEPVILQRLAHGSRAGRGTGSPSGGMGQAISNPGSGAPLDRSVRRRVEPVLGADLSGVRVHNNTTSRQASREINARAFTHGNHIHLGEGQSSSDLKLMAHELTHVVQQGAPKVQTHAENPPETGAFQGNKQSLRPDIATHFQSAYGESLNNVALHTDSVDPGKHGVDALTYGDAIAFAPGRYQPESQQGLALIGHELAHVVQQRRGQRLGLQGAEDDPSHSSEHEAWQASHAALSGKPARINAAPPALAGGSAGGCFMPGVPGNVVGMRAHSHIQNYYNAVGVYSEVTIPAAGQADLVYSTTPPAVPVGQSSAIRPPGYLTSPPHPAPALCAIGEIKPISCMAAGCGIAQNLAYIAGMNAYYGTNNTDPLIAPPPPILVTGDPTFIAWPPQMLHLIPGPSGVYYYFCRPMGELLPIMEYLRERLEEWLQQLRELWEQVPELRPIIEPVLEPVQQLARAIAEGLEAAANWAWDHLWEILAVVAIIVVVVLVVIFAAEIAAALAAALATITAAVEALMALLASMEAAAAAFAAFLATLGFSSAALAQEPSPPQQPPTEPDQPPQPELPGCFPADVQVTLADGTTKNIADIEVGQKVVAWDERANLLRPCQVVAVHRHPPEPLLSITLSDQRRLVVTHLHTLRADGQWKLARDIQRGDTLYVAADDTLQPAAVIGIEDALRHEPVFNLSVAQCETYLAQGILVHNIGIAKPRPPQLPPEPEIGPQDLPD